MSNDKKPKKAKPPIIHGGHRNGEAASKLLDPTKKAAGEIGKKKN